MSMQIKNFLEMTYDELEEKNLELKQAQKDRAPDEHTKERVLKFLHDPNALKAVPLAFSDLEGRFHMLDYDKKFLLGSYNNLTFDGSSIRGFSVVKESDLRLDIDWGSFRFLPSDVFGPGKVFVFASIRDRDGSAYGSDMRGKLKDFCAQLYAKSKLTAFAAVEIEGFLFEGVNIEQSYSSREGFKFVNGGGYYNSLPKDPLKLFIDKFAEAQRALGFEKRRTTPRWRRPSSSSTTPTATP